MKAQASRNRTRRKRYIEVTPQLLAVLTVDRISAYVESLHEKPANWWFAIQDIDLALTSQMIAYLSGSAQLGALDEADQKTFLAYDNNPNPSKPNPIDRKGQALEGRIASFSKLLTRAESPEFGFVDNSRNFLKITDAERRDILKLHNFRSDLAHIRPLTWSVQLAGLPRMATACIHALAHLFGHSNQRMHLTANQNRLMTRNLKSILMYLEAMV